MLLYTITVKPPNSGHFGSSSVVRCWEVVPISEVVEKTTPLVNGRMWAWRSANYTWTSWTKMLNEHQRNRTRSYLGSCASVKGRNTGWHSTAAKKWAWLSAFRGDFVHVYGGWSFGNEHRVPCPEFRGDRFSLRLPKYYTYGIFNPWLKLCLL